MSQRSRWIVGLLPCLLLACGDDAGASDAGPGADGGRPDAAGGDAGEVTEDAGRPGEDAGPGGTDAGAPFDCEGEDRGIELGEAIDAPPGEWTFVPFPDARCMDGSSTGIGINPNPASNDVVIFLEGGGICANSGTCIAVAHPDGFDAATLAETVPFFDNGILRRDAPDDNPVTDWNMVFVPYCSGDVHGGSTDSGALGRVQQGYVNFREYLERLVPTFDGADRVLLTGVSAGGFGALVNFVQTQRAFACTRVYLLDDAGPPMSDMYMKPCFQQGVRDLWNLAEAVPDDCDACTGPDGGGLVNIIPYVLSRFPDNRFGLISRMEDQTIRGFYGYGYAPMCLDNLFPFGMPSTDYTAGLLELREIGAPYENFKTFYLPGRSHTELGKRLTTVENGGIDLAQWIRQLIDDDDAWDHVGP